MIEHYIQILPIDWFSIPAKKFDAIIAVNLTQVEVADHITFENFVHLKRPRIGQFNHLTTLTCDLHFHPKSSHQIRDAIWDSKFMDQLTVTHQFQIFNAHTRTNPL